MSSSYAIDEQRPYGRSDSSTNEYFIWQAEKTQDSSVVKTH